MTRDEFTEFCRQVPPDSSKYMLEQLQHSVWVDANNHRRLGLPFAQDALEKHWRLALAKEALLDLGFDEARVMAFTASLS